MTQKVEINSDYNKNTAQASQFSWLKLVTIIKNSSLINPAWAVIPDKTIKNKYLCQLLIHNT
jgi:hypothetical protein